MPASYGTHALAIPTGLERALGPKAFRDYTDTLDKVLNGIEQDLAELEDAPAAVQEVLTGTLAARPKFGTGPVPRLYVVSADTAARNGTTYLDTGTAWILTGSPTTTPSVLPTLVPRQVLTYDASGNLATITVTTSDGTTTIYRSTLSYDGTGNLSSVVTVAGSITRTRTLTYDGSGNLTGATETETSA